MSVVRGLYYPAPIKGYTKRYTLYVTGIFMKFLMLAMRMPKEDKSIEVRSEIICTRLGC